MHHTRLPRRRPVSRFVATVAALALVATACNDDADDGAIPDLLDDTTTTVAPDPDDDTDDTDDATTTTTEVPDEAPPEEDDVDEGVSLEIAVRSTLDQGSADYTIRIAHGTPDDLDDDGFADVGAGGTNDAGTDTGGTGTDTGGATDDDHASPDDTPGTPGGGRDDADEVDGRVHFRERLRAVTLDLDGDEREVIVDDGVIYVQLDDDEALAGDDGAEWGRIDIGGLEAGAGDDTDTDTATLGDGVSLNMLVALHDPGSVLAAVTAGQAGTAEDDAGTVAQPDREGRRETVNIGADEIEDPLTQLMVRQLGADLAVHVWFDGDGDEARVERIAYAVPTTTGTGTTPGTGTGTDDAGATTTDDTGTDDTAGADDTTTTTDGTGTTGDTGTGTAAGMGRFVVVDFDNLGGADEIELPEQDDVRDIEFTAFGTVVAMVLPGLGTDATATGTDAPGVGQDTDDAADAGDLDEDDADADD